MHALPGCSVPQDRAQTGTAISTDCNVQVNFNQGCGTLFTAPADALPPVLPASAQLACHGAVQDLRPACDGAQAASAPSFGAPFNGGGGGWYAMSKTRDAGVSIWFWPRGALAVPAEVQYGAAVVAPSVSWGTPAAFFPLGDNCSYDGHFDAHKIVFDLTLCVRALRGWDGLAEADRFGVRYCRATGRVRSGPSPSAARGRAKIVRGTLLLTHASR
jgi:hypothetical protein